MRETCFSSLFLFHSAHCGPRSLLHSSLSNLRNKHTLWVIQNAPLELHQMGQFQHFTDQGGASSSISSCVHLRRVDGERRNVCSQVQPPNCVLRGMATFWEVISHRISRVYAKLLLFSISSQFLFLNFTVSSLSIRFLFSVVWKCLNETSHFYRRHTHWPCCNQSVGGTLHNQLLQNMSTSLTNFVSCARRWTHSLVLSSKLFFTVVTGPRWRPRTLPSPATRNIVHTLVLLCKQLRTTGFLNRSST